MSLMITLIGGDSSGNTVNLPSIPASTFENAEPYPNVSSGVKFDSDGNIYRNQSNGGWSAVGTWLHKGAAGSYYIQRTISSGTLDTDDSSAVEPDNGLVLSTDRVYNVIETLAAGTDEASVLFEISTDEPGTTVVAGPVTYSFHAETEGGFP